MKIYLVGGAVRDELLGKEVNDFDYLVVGGTVGELEAKYGKQVGMDFPVFLDKETGAQYAMARRERKNGVGYHGFDVEFGSDVTLAEDLSRRDLTINALARDLDTGEITDCFGGLGDLQNKILRHTSHAFSEDPLRVIRLARFFARYGDFTVAPETMFLAHHLVESGEMDALPYERYWLELEKAVHEGHVNLFFEFISELKGFEKIKFFQEVFGGIDTAELINRAEKISKALRATLAASPEEWLTFFTALTAKPDLQPISSAPSKMFSIQANVKRLNNPTFGAAEIFELLKTTKAWSQSTLIDDIVRAVGILNKAGYSTPVEPYELVMYADVVCEVDSEAFIHLQGPEIGKAMEAERRSRVKELYSIFTDDN